MQPDGIGELSDALAKGDFSKAKQIKVTAVKTKSQDGAIKLQVKLQLADGWKINELAPASYWLQAAGDSVVISGQGALKNDAAIKIVEAQAP